MATASKFVSGSIFTCTHKHTHTRALTSISLLVISQVNLHYVAAWMTLKADYCG